MIVKINKNQGAEPARKINNMCPRLDLTRYNVFFMVEFTEKNSFI